MVTKLSPTRIVSTVMGAWFLATAFSNYLASLIAMLTRVSQGEDSQIVPAPIETVGIYGEVFGKIAVTAIVSALILFALTPILKRWMHIGVEDEQEATAS
jgi:POT family proton-dependent oligopeptide transporter